MSNDTYFDRLDQAIASVQEYLTAQAAVLQSSNALTKAFQYGGVAYGQTESRTLPLASLGGKPCHPVSRMHRHLTVSIYRLESGRYEVTKYIR